jgi:hypothetical protein
MLRHVEEEVLEEIFEEEVAEEAGVALVVAMAATMDHHQKEQPAKSARRLGTTRGGA